MRILHYGLGFPPYRSGGLTKFTVDLMQQQTKEGHQVALLWPGHYSIPNRKTDIKKHRNYCDIESYEVINPTPVSYDEGILETGFFMQEGDEEQYKAFLQEFKPEVLHIETLMGLHKALIFAAKSLGIRVVFSAHDFFPICPKVTLFRDGTVCSRAEACGYCESCNQTALSIGKIRVLQSSMYRTLKDSAVVRRLRKSHRNGFQSEAEALTGNTVSEDSAIKYLELRDYYKSMLKLTDRIHYNSLITQQIYERYMGRMPSVVQTITHSDVCDKCSERSYNKHLRLTYLGPYNGAKGFFFLKRSLDQLWNEGFDFSLNVYFDAADLPPYIHKHDRYTYGELENVFNETDVLIVPSIWYETFGYTVIEALGYGVPVLVSSHVGAKDVIPEGAGIIYDAENQEQLLMAIRSLSVSRRKSMNMAVCEKYKPLTIKNMAEALMNRLYGEIDG